MNTKLILVHQKLLPLLAATLSCRKNILCLFNNSPDLPTPVSKTAPDPRWDRWERGIQKELYARTVWIWHPLKTTPALLCCRVYNKDALSAPNLHSPDFIAGNVFQSCLLSLWVEVEALWIFVETAQIFPLLLWMLFLGALLNRNRVE